MKTTKLTIGLDLGDRRHTVCVLNHAGEIIAETTIPNTRESLDELSKQYRGASIAMETGTHSPWISRLLESKGHPVYVANARKVRAISQSQTKTDKEDVWGLDGWACADPALGGGSGRRQLVQCSLEPIHLGKSGGFRFSHH